MRARVTVAILFLILTARVLAQKKACTEDDAKHAESAIDDLKTWNSVYSFYKRFAQCDDGSIGEGISDAVVKLFANRWHSLNDLRLIAEKDKPFEQFVLRHVDETTDWRRDAQRIRENASQHCPANSRNLCKALIARTGPQ